MILKLVRESLSFTRGNDPKDMLGIGIPPIPDDGLEFVGWVHKVIKMFHPNDDSWELYETLIEYIFMILETYPETPLEDKHTFLKKLIETGFDIDMIKLFYEKMDYFYKFYSYL